jgi:hypothetical protein
MTKLIKKIAAQPSYLFLVPPLMTFIARSPLVSEEALSNLKFAATGAASVSSQVLKEVIEKTKSVGTIIKNGKGQMDCFLSK